MVRRYTPGTYKVDVSNIVALQQPTEEQKPKAKLPVSEKYKKLDEKLGGILPLGAPKNKFAIPTPQPSENNPVLTATRQPVKENAVLTATKKPVTNNKVLQSITELGQKKPKPKVEVVEPKAARKQVTTKPSPTGASLWAGDEHTKRTLNVDAKLRDVGLPSSAELRELNYDPEFALNNPSFIKMVLKLPGAKPGAVLPGKAGQFETRTMERAGEIMAPGGKPTEATTGNKVLDVIADLVGTGLGFTTPGGAGGAVMGAGEKALQGLLANKVAPQILGKIPSKLVPLVERNAKVGLGGGLYGGLEIAAQGGSPAEIAKGAAEEAAMFMLADSVFAGLGKLAKAGYVHVRGALAGKGISKPMGEVRYEKTTPGQYESQGYEEFKPGSGIWVKRDANGAILDQQYVMVSVNGQVVPQYKLFQAGNRMGRILSTQEQEVIAKQFNANLEAKRVSVPEETKVVPEVKEQEVKKPFVTEEEIPVVEVKPVEEAKVEVKEEKPVVEEKPVTEQQVAQPKPTKQEPAIEQPTQVTPEVKPAKAKEAWEMTQEDYRENVEQSYKFEEDEIVSPNEYILPPHEVRDIGNKNKIAKSMKEQGWVGRPILVAEGPNGLQALTGSHRIAVAKELEVDIPIVRINQEALETFLAENDMNLDDFIMDRDDIEKWLPEIDKRATEIFNAEVTIEDAKYDHKGIVRQALAEGKPVPPQVLADYPDLVKEQPKPAEVQKVKEVKPSVEKQEKVVTKKEPQPSKEVAGKLRSQAETLKGKTTTAKTERGKAVQVEYAVIDVDELVASHDIYLKPNKEYLSELQPRNRERMASEAQINSIVANLEPEFLGESPKVSEGAPIIGNDRIVESGNGRVIALQRAYSSNHKNIEKYKKWLIQNAEKFGLTDKGIKKVKNPVLVRIRKTEVNRQEFVQEANEQAVAAMSASEQAMSDAKKLNNKLLSSFVPNENGELLTLANHNFISNFIGEVISPAEKGKYLTNYGAVSQEGITRIKNALFAKAYGDIGAIEKLAESTDNNIKNITNAMLMAAPKTAVVKNAIGKGELYDLDISPELVGAMNKLSYLRETGQSIDTFIRQMSFVDDLTPLAKDILLVLDKNKRSARKLNLIFQEYNDAIEKLGNPKQLTLFGTSVPTKAELFQAVIRRVESYGEAQTTIFGNKAVGGSQIGAVLKEEGRGKENKETIGIKQAKKELATEFDEEVYNFPSDIPAPQKTSLNQIASGLRMAISQKIFKDGMTVVDVGGGRFNKGMEYLANNGINGMVYDPYARTKEHNDSILNKLKLSDGADGIALNNVLNVIKENQERADVLEFAYRLLKPNGKMVVSVYEGNKSGTGKLREFSDGTFTWQENRLLGDYLKEIKQALPEARIAKKGSIFVITKLSQGEGTLEAPQAIPNILGKLGWQQQPQKKIISRRDLVDYLRKELDLPIRVARYSNKAKGIYKIKPEVVRTKIAHDLDVIVHEVGHHLDKVFGLTKGDEYKNELLGLLTPKQVKQLGGKAKLEGAAEFLRYYIANINLAKQKAPLFFEHFEKTVSPEVIDIIDGFRRDWDIYRRQDARTDVLSAISVNEKVKAKLSWTKVYAALVDELAPLEKAVKEMTQGLDVSPEDNPFIRAWVARGWTGKAQVHVDELGKILEKVKDLDDLRAYMVSKRAIELHEKRGYDKDRFPFLIESAYKVVEKLETPELKETFGKLKELQDRVLQAYADAGMLTKETLTKMRKLNEEYIPFYRVFDENLTPVNFGKSGAGKKFVGLGQAVKTIKGSTRQIIDPLESILKDIYTLTSLAERNRVGVSFIELTSKLDGGGKWAEKLVPKMKVTSFQLEEISKILEQAGANVEELDMGQMATIFRPNMFLGAREGMENIVTVWRNGKPEFWQLDPEVYRSMLFLDSTSMNIVEKILSVPASWLRVGATTTLEFMAKNPFRDVSMALVDGRLKLPDIFRGLASALKRDALYEKWLSSGGAHAEMVSMDRDYLQFNLRKLLREKTLKGKVKGVVLHPIETLRTISMVTEQATRIGAFSRALKEGKGLNEAAVISRDITVDFGRTGFATKHVNPMVAFFNANIQGLDKTIRMFKRDPAGCFARAVMFITVPSVLLYLMNHDDPNYQELPTWKKDMFWNIPMGNGHFLSLPKPFELGMIFGTTAEKFMEFAYTKDKHAFDDFLKETAGNILPNPVPTAMMPWVETIANRSLYTGRPIVPQRESRLTPELQYGPYTSETAKGLGKLLDFSPRKIDNIIRGYTGGLGSYTTGAMDSILKLTGAAKPSKTAKDFDERMVIRGFVASPSAGGAASIEQIYNMSEKAETLYASLREMKKQNIPFPKLNKEQVGLINALPSIRKVTENLSELRKAAREVQTDPKLTPAERKQKLDAIDMLQINYARKVLGKDLIK